MHEVEAERLFDLIADRAATLVKLDPREALPPDQREQVAPSGGTGKHTAAAIAAAEAELGGAELRQVV